MTSPAGRRGVLPLYQRYWARGAAALADGQPVPRRVWNKLPGTVAAAVIDLALKEPELPPGN